jgi:hypothetical protein
VSLGRSANVHPQCEQARHRIARVGTIEVDEKGGLFLDHWHFEFHVTWMEGVDITDLKFSVQVIDNLIAGWTAAELHDIAHGWPCRCPVSEVARRSVA